MPQSSLRVCRECDTRFEGQRWQRLCWRCWREQKDAEARRDEYQKGFIAGMAAGAKLGHGAKRSRFDRDLLTAAIQLTHPDRHPAERRDLATSTTASLLELREEVAA
jgi:hypothetical protein